MAAPVSNSKTEFFQPKRQTGIKKVRQFPVPLEHEDLREWPVCKGVLNGFNVVVEDSETMARLYYGGYFGKGNLSRSEPSHNDVANKLQTEEEKLHLTFEEAFFLSYALGCLQVSENANELNVQQMWKRLSDLQEDFVERYVAYHYFRSKSWIVRSGTKFGADFLLYKKGPDFFHASYSVLVVPVDKPNNSGIQEMSWRDVCGLNRVSEAAAKELLLCYVYFPTDMSLEAPICLPQFSVDEAVVKRWVPSQRRNSEPGDEEDL